MLWKEIFPSNRQPSMKEIAGYIGGGARELWESLIDYMDAAYKAKPKLSYSVCAGKPGWNVKFQKSGQSFGTLYPEENSFSVFIVIGYKFEAAMEPVLPKLSRETAELYKNAADYMKMGRWMMFRIEDPEGLEDYKRLVSVKLRPAVG